jgi:heme exporter protein D
MAMTFLAFAAAVIGTVVNTRRFVRAVKRIRERRLERMLR